MNHISILDKSDCYGCNACVQICPMACITMEIDEKGFWYPRVDQDRCVKCGRCIESCQMYGSGNRQAIPSDNIKVYAVKHKSDSIRDTSSSGGLFTALSDYVLSQGGFVYGAVFNDKFDPVQTSAATYSERDRMKGSKYVQSYVADSYREVKDLLEEEKLVLYTGTPCQIGGLYKYLRIEYNNLITCDLICHGTPSPGIFKKYLELVESHAGGKMKKINFKDKRSGWGNCSLTMTFENKSYSNLLACDPYGKLFLDNIILRPSCYHCIYANVNRLADISMGDFWGIQHNMADFDDNRGVSLVLVNTEVGRAIFSNIGGDIIFRPSRLEDCVPYNTLSAPSQKPPENDFWYEYVKGEELAYLLIKYSLKGIIANRFFLDRTLEDYIFKSWQADKKGEVNIISESLNNWQLWCNRTFFDLPQKYHTKIPEYKQDQVDVRSYGAFSIISTYINKRSIRDRE